MHWLDVPIWREARIALEWHALNGDPVLRGQGVERGDGRPVLLIPGFMAGDLSLATMSDWLRRLGYAPCRAGIRANVDCTARALDRLEDQLERLSESYGRRVSIVGHSRGGSMARVLAVRRPDLVEGIVCLGSPLRDQFAVHPLVRAQIFAVGLLGTLGVHGLFSRDCRDGDCCAQAWADGLASFPEGVSFTSIYSRNDGVVDWHACLDPAATQVEVHSTHCGMASNAEVFTAIGQALTPPSQGSHRPSSVVAVRPADALAA